MRGKNMFYRHGTTDFSSNLCLWKVDTPILHGIWTICKHYSKRILKSVDTDFKIGGTAASSKEDYLFLNCVNYI